MKVARQKQFLTKKLADLKGQAFNPKSRTEHSAIAGLAKDIDEIGLLYPILIDQKGNIIDGHRRVAAVILLEWDEIECIVVITDDVGRVFASVNANTLKLKSVQNLQIWFQEPNAVTPKMAAYFDKMRDLLGIDLLRKMAAKGMSRDGLTRANKVARHLGVEDPAYLRTIIKWFLKYSCSAIADEAIKRGLSPAKLRRCIDNDTELVVKMR